MNVPLVSIFVQVYRTERYLERCLSSVLALDGGYELEVLVIDDASPDRSWEIVQSFQDPRLTTIRHDKNTGANATANEGYAWGTGKYFARLDSDDAYRPSFLQRLVPLLESQPRAGLAYGDIALIDERDAVTSARGNVPRHGRPAVGDELFALASLNFVPAASTLVRREALQGLLPVPPQYQFLDWYISLGIAERWQTAYCDEVVSDYRVHPASASKTMIADLSGEKTTFSVLDHLWRSDFRSAEKQRWRGRVYGANYLTCAEKYFGIGDYKEARRCYQAALRLNPSLGLDAGVLRRFAATHVGKERYEATKALARRIIARR